MKRVSANLCLIKSSGIIGKLTERDDFTIFLWKIFNKNFFFFPVLNDNFDLKKRAQIVNTDSIKDFYFKKCAQILNTNPINYL